MLLSNNKILSYKFIIKFVERRLVISNLEWTVLWLKCSIAKYFYLKDSFWVEKGTYFNLKHFTTFRWWVIDERTKFISTRIEIQLLIVIVVHYNIPSNISAYRHLAPRLLVTNFNITIYFRFKTVKTLFSNKLKWQSIPVFHLSVRKEVESRCTNF